MQCGTSTHLQPPFFLLPGMLFPQVACSFIQSKSLIENYFLRKKYTLTTLSHITIPLTLLYFSAEHLSPFVVYILYLFICFSLLLEQNS